MCMLQVPLPIRYDSKVPNSHLPLLRVFCKMFYQTHQNIHPWRKPVVNKSNFKIHFTIAFFAAGVKICSLWYASCRGRRPFFLCPGLDFLKSFACAAFARDSYVPPSRPFKAFLYRCSRLGWGFSVAVYSGHCAVVCGVETGESGVKKRATRASRFELMSRFYVTGVT